LTSLFRSSSPFRLWAFDSFSHHGICASSFSLRLSHRRRPTLLPISLWLARRFLGPNARLF
jgi:hypothetical protein